MANQKHSHAHDDSRGHPHPHDHTHGTIDPALVATERGLWAVKWSLIGLGATALFQVLIVFFSGSVALLADTIHNIADAATAIPLWIAFALARRKPSHRFTYGYGRVEDVAGVMIVLTILFSALLAGYESIYRLRNPQPIDHLWAVVLAAIVGFAGNEAVAILRIRVGKQINSAALVADGYHARVDGLTSLAVLFSAVAVWLGYPLADPIVGLVITVAILAIVWESGKNVFTRLLDGVDPEVTDEITHALNHAQGVRGVTEIRLRWSGHRLLAEVNLGVSRELSVTEGHAIAVEARHQLLHKLPYLANVTIHIDPEHLSGENHHGISEHAHGGSAHHSHR
ncbi:MAG TPA: cation diffusion facilitator family transporter [Candidatus Binatia bacterium]|jgi:cation diffusion facilitator family transporter|nr:cation diffusion facilitator family transporter [Candidatus Binatia bacterium]